MHKLLFALVFTSITAMADPPHIVDGKTGKYLGNLSSNRYDPDSVNNEYGRYGNRYSPDSINNEFGQYGSKYSNDSPHNPHATNAPKIIGGDDDDWGDDE